MSDVNLDFTPVSSVARLFTATPEHKFLFVLGPIGSTKTTTCLFFMLMTAARQAPSPDGIRRTRFAIIRNTLTSLKQTVLKDAMSLFGEIASWNGSDNTLRFRIADMDSEWLFMPLEHAEDQRRLLSLQLTAIYLNEIREIDFQLMISSFSRTGRYPSPKHGGVDVTHSFILGDSNMGTIGSELYQFLEEEDHPEVLYIHQPSALSPQADWRHFLRKHYYDDIQIGQTKAWIDTHVHSMWSHDLTGLPIFADVFNRNYHVSDEPLTTVHSYPLLVGLDPGFNPAAIVCQLNHRGQLRVYREIHAPNCLFSIFVNEHILPVVTLPGYSMKPLMFIMDPSGINRNAVTGLSPYGYLEEQGLDVTIASTNDIQPRISGIERLLVETRGIESNINPVPMPGIIIDPSCEILIRALSGEYRYKKRKLTGELEDKPEKKHPISDVTDALGYVALGLGSPVYAHKAKIGRYPTAAMAKPNYQQPSRRAWT